MNRLYVGAAKVCITPPAEMMPAHFHSPFVFEGVYRDIYVRSLVIDNGSRRIALISYESGDVSRTPDLLDALGKECGLRRENVLFSAVHSHESPTFSHEHWRVIGNPEKRAKVLQYGDFIIGQTVKCVSEAISRLRPAHYGLGVGKSYINVCRDEQFENGLWAEGRNFEGPSDKELGVLAFWDEEGRLIAGLANYAVHGNLCFRAMDEKGEKYLIAGDLPGMTSAYLEERYRADGTVFLWTSGAAGNQNSIFNSDYWSYNHDGTHTMNQHPGYGVWAMAEHLAQVHAVDIIRTLKKIQRTKDWMAITVVDRNLQLPGQKIIYAKTSTMTPLERANMPFDGTIADDEPVNLQLKLITMDDIAFFCLNGELCTEIGLHLKEVSPLKHTFIITHTAERAGYLPSRQGYDNHTAEFYASQVKDGCTEERLIPAALEMFDERLKG